MKSKSQNPKFRDNPHAAVLRETEKKSEKLYHNLPSILRLTFQLSMESQLQNPEFKINPETFHQTLKYSSMGES